MGLSTVQDHAKAQHQFFQLDWIHGFGVVQDKKNM